MHKPFAQLLARQMARRSALMRAELDRLQRQLPRTNSADLGANAQAGKQPPTATPSAGTDENHGE